MISLKDCGYDKAQSFTSRCSLFGVDCDNATLLPAMNCAGQF